MSASLSANQRVMLTSGQTDNGKALNAHGARSIRVNTSGVYWGFHPAITVNDGTYETLFIRRPFVPYTHRRSIEKPAHGRTYPRASYGLRLTPLSTTLPSLFSRREILPVFVAIREVNYDKIRLGFDGDSREDEFLKNTSTGSVRRKNCIL